MFAEWSCGTTDRRGVGCWLKLEVLVVATAWRRWPALSLKLASVLGAVWAALKRSYGVTVWGGVIVAWRYNPQKGSLGAF